MAAKGSTVPIYNFNVDALKELCGSGEWFTLGTLGNCGKILVWVEVNLQWRGNHACNML